MKKIISLILALVMCLSLAACASEEDKAFEAANALLEAGDYDGAIAAFTAIGRYQEITDKIAQAKQMKSDAEMGFLYGMWMNTTSSEHLIFGEDGIVIYGSNTESYNWPYSMEEGVIRIDGMITIRLNVSETDGCTHLTGDNFDFIREEDYAKFGPQPVEITMENWSEYFELRETPNVHINDFGEIVGRDHSYGIFLKDEYYNRLADNYEAVNVNFELTYDEACFKATDYNKETFDSAFIGDLTFESCKGPTWWEPESGQTTTATVYDQRTWEDTKYQQDPYYQKVAAQFYMSNGWSEDGNTLYYFGSINVQVSRVQGSLLLYP